MRSTISSNSAYGLSSAPRRFMSWLQLKRATAVRLKLELESRGIRCELRSHGSELYDLWTPSVDLSDFWCREEEFTNLDKLRLNVAEAELALVNARLAIARAELELMQKETK